MHYGRKCCHVCHEVQIHRLRGINLSDMHHGQQVPSRTCVHQPIMCAPTHHACAESYVLRDQLIRHASWPAGTITYLPPMHYGSSAISHAAAVRPCTRGTAYAQFIRYAPLGNHVLCYVLREHSRACQRCTNLCIMSELCSSVSAPCTMGGSAAMYAMRCKFIGYAGSTYQTCIMGRAPITENSRYYHVCTNPPIMRITYASCIIPGGLRSSTVDAYLDVLLEHAHTMNMRLDSMLSSVLLHRVWCTRLASVGVVLSSARHTGTITNMATYYGSSLQGAINGWSSREGQKGWPKRGC
eukprot:TRINITY_DN306_c0_g1_i4.p1 TRINITY_DN306_c0_g1~~TRINITY_DN306_c0_g1_i4.p1  ORF type:complete len:297 (-),score=-27.30 TRINITY_DN306_c0_g1_i4:152-1042(-)